MDERFISDTAGLLCNSASLPGTGFATADIIGNFQGVSEKMAHSRMFNQIELEFYVDNEYKSMRFLEHWMEFISAGSTEPSLRDGYYFRMSYPDDYKSNQTKIIKFDRDYKNEIEYTFYGLFPLALNSTRVSYNNSDILKASAIFNFDRYIYGDVSSASTYRRNYVNSELNPLHTSLGSISIFQYQSMQSLEVVSKEMSSSAGDTLRKDEQKFMDVSKNYHVLTESNQLTSNEFRKKIFYPIKKYEDLHLLDAYDGLEKISENLLIEPNETIGISEYGITQEISLEILEKLVVDHPRAIITSCIN